MNKIINSFKCDFVVLIIGFYYLVYFEIYIFLFYVYIYVLYSLLGIWMEVLAGILGREGGGEGRGGGGGGGGAVMELVLSGVNLLQAASRHFPTS